MSESVHVGELSCVHLFCAHVLLCSSRFCVAAACAVVYIETLYAAACGTQVRHLPSASAPGEAVLDLTPRLTPCGLGAKPGGPPFHQL